MGYKTDNIVRDLSKIIINPNRRKTSSYDSSATVTRVENDIMYVRMPGSTEEMPVKRTVNGKVGDVVQVRVSGHTGFVVGNATNPPTDDSTAIAANRVATDALAKSVEAIEANLVTARQLQADEARITNLQAEKASVEELTAAKARIETLETDHVSLNDITAVRGSIDTLSTGKADIDLANVNNAWIENGVVKDAAISDAKIIGVSANKLTAGTIDASDITVTNLNADNITTGTINGQRIGEGSLGLNKLSEAVYTETEVDNKLKTMQDEIDGAIETWTGTVVPTLNNEPASKWQNDAAKDKHVGDVYYVVNAGNQADGYCYRFTKSGTTYSWTLIKDSDVTAALQRLVDAEGDIDGLQTFQSTTSSWMTNTDSELLSLKTRTSTVETSLGNKVETSTFNNLSQTVDDNTASITSLTNTVNTKADGSTVETLSNTVNTVSQKANSNESKITNLTTTVNGIDTRVSTAESSITQQATAIESKVSKDGVISTINQSAESVTIDAQKVNIAGAAIFGDYTKTTQMNAAIAAAKADAEKTATNYITAIQGINGITVHDANDLNNFTNMNSNGMSVYVGGSSASNRYATFGPVTQIGADEESHIKVDYHSLRQYSYEPYWGINDQYFYVGDFRDKDNDYLAEMHDYFVASGTENYYNLSAEAVDTNYTVTIDGDTSGATLESKDIDSITFSTQPSFGATITVDYYTDGTSAKALTFGGRMGKLGGLSSSFGRMNKVTSYCSFGCGEDVYVYGNFAHGEGKNTRAYGDSSHAEGRGSKATGRYSHAEGESTEAKGWASHASGSHTVAKAMGQTAMGYYNVEDGTSLLIVGNGSDGSPSNAMKLDVSGNEVIAGRLTQSSDRRLKDHIDYLDEDAVEFVRGLKPAHYIKDDEHHVGFYAQDVDEVDKWDCMTGEMNGYMTLGYTEIIAPLVKYCQHLEARIDELEKRK